MGSVKITYETLFDLLRREKSREPIQSLDPEFYQDVSNYLTEKMTLLNSTDSFLSSEAEKTKIQIQNIHKIIRELYERREQKIIKLASDKVRTGSNIIDTSNLLDPEKHYFENLVKIFSTQKNNVLLPIISGKRISQSVMTNFSTESYSSNIAKEEENAFEEKSYDETDSSFENKTLESEQNDFEPENEDETEEDTGIEPHETADELEENSQIQNPEFSDSAVENKIETNLENNDAIKIKFIKAVPKFLGKELETYGPFEPDTEAELPNIIADILIKKGRAVASNS